VIKARIVIVPVSCHI